MSIDRRDFLKGAGITGIAAATMGLAGCSPAAETKEAEPVQYPGITSAEDFENSAVIIDPITEFESEESYDIVVVGAGTAGLPAALTALEEGATVAVLQKESKPISQGGSSTGFVKEGCTDLGILRFIAKYRELCDYRINEKLLKTYLLHSGETIMWMNKNATAAGYPPYTTVNEMMNFEDDSYVTKLTNRFGPKPENNGTMVEHLAEYAADKGVVFYYNTPGVQLVFDGERVTGVIGKTSSGYIKLNAAKGVILATGDYQNNDSMVEKYSPDLVNFDRKQIGKTGDGHLMSMLIGAKMCAPNHSRQMHDGDSGPMGAEPFLALDINGNRFMNEEVSMNYWNDVLRTNAYPAGQFCHVFDNDYAADVAEWGGMPASEKQMLAHVPNSGVSAEEGGMIHGIIDSLLDTHYADTIEELAEMLRLPADAMKKSVDRYNEMCDNGEDLDFGKQKKYLKRIDNPPFWGVRRNVRITAICGGIAVDENYQVVNENDEPIPGLYSAGFNAGDICGTIDWSTYVVGMSCGTCMTSGRVAACHAVTGKPEPTNPVTWEEMQGSYQIFGKNGGISGTMVGRS